MIILNSFLTYFEDDQMPFLRAFEFYFACELRDKEGIRVFGTGGNILGTLIKLMGSFRHLEELRLENLLLDGFDAEHLLDNIYESCGSSIMRLSIINCTKFHHFFMHCGLFLNLRYLTVSPNHLHYDLVYLVSELRYLLEFHIVQTKFTTNGRLLDHNDWRPLRNGRRFVKVFLEAAGKTKDEILWQQHAPVFAVAYYTPYSRLSLLSALEIVKNYGDSVYAYCQFGLPRFPYKRSRPMNERCDSLLLLLVRTCINLSHIVIHELISMATLLLIAHQTKGRLRTIFVRKNALLKKHAWRNGEDQVKLTADMQEVLTNASNYQSFVKEMNVLLGCPLNNWRPLTDKEFKELSFDSLNKK
ncbi:hypothetical protein RvY_10034 [Ramazzottius varieornatus]|uniref:F-box domain-containing protein n=1 Tax=Ramazzottius varieornatus TaxID=947166 RepID=A0A1D1VBF0_RAMVA|nr:hypothetical protein RvY_10034 [Ramazzottius varieornatus]